MPYNQNHKWGFATISGDIVIKPTFDSVSFFYDGFAEAYKLGKVGLIDTKGNWIVPPIFDGIRLLDKKKRLFEVSKEIRKKDSTWSFPCGIYKQNIGLLTPLKFYSVKEYNSNKYALEGKGGLNYLVDLKTKKISRLHHSDFFDCGCGRSYERQYKAEQKFRKYLKKRPFLEELNTIYFYHKDRKLGGYFVYDTVYNYKSKKWIKYIDSIPAIYDTIQSVSYYKNELFYVKQNSKWGVVNNKGKTILQPLYDTIIKEINQPYFLVKNNNKYGIFNTSGEVIFDCNQDKVIIPCNYSNKFFLGKSENKWAVNNDEGKPLFENVYDTVKINCYWNDDCAIVKKGNKYGIIDTKGILKYPVIYDDLVMRDSFLIYQLNGLYGVRNLKTNKDIIPHEWDLIKTDDGYYNDGFFKYFILKKGNQYGVHLPIGNKPKKLFFPIADTDEIELPLTYLYKDNVAFIVFGIHQGDKFYYVGENFIKFTAH